MEKFFSKYQLLKTNNMPWIVGTGANCSVQLAKNKKTDQIFAVKRISRKQSTKESNIHSMFKHQNIVQFIEFFYDSNINSSFIVLEYIPNGTLADLQNNNLSLTEQEICQIFNEICKGLEAIHEAQVIHKDLKPANIIFDKNWNAKICDFGSAIRVSDKKQVCGTFQYMAPQILQQRSYDSRVDIWAIGVMMYEMLEKKLPFNEKSIDAQLRKMHQSISFQKISSLNFRQIIRKMLQFNPQLRPSISQVKHVLQQIQSKPIKNQNYLSSSLHQDHQSFILKIYQSQNSTVDSHDSSKTDKRSIMEKIDKKQSKSNKVISLKEFRPINQKSLTPKIIITQPVMKETSKTNYISTIFSPKIKISIKQLIKSKRF